MIIDLPNTRTREIAHKIEQLHEERGESATGRVLTLLIATDDSELEHALEVANAASREHPCRVIAIVPDTEHSDNAEAGANTADGATDGATDGASADTGAKPMEKTDNPAVDLTDGPAGSNLNAQVRFGADAGAGEIIILRPRNGLINHPDTMVIPLLVPDVPVVAWWPTNPPSNPSKDLMGAMARSRLTDAMRSNNPEATIERLRRNWTPEDVDLSWTRLTVWRGLLASMLDQPPHLPITAVKVSGPKEFLPMDLLCAWLRLKLGVNVDVEYVDGAEAVTGVYLTRADGVVSLERPHEDQALISMPGQAPQAISVPVRTIEDCLTEELRRIDPDEVYAEVINEGWDLIRH
ncbi:OpcA protein [Bifidobacterium sp. UTBIF-68]|uniref:glucose-6-phosphate dehydrogenase assembly protein OpcA n=1 Tax=Bifidobacterium sp. UTBIF-68 TaxID=1465262 RepID=UPI00112AB8D1|nr:glucose-6-phosphate dehydrogenase assembly protein OpcA [Bifidobacterium sp. UTBIF-68]TPF93528.1 OpcA protein [Bifidobacterium sp. UTBIF-68]